MDDCDIVVREQPDLLGVDLDAVRCDDPRVEQARSREAPDPALPVRVDEERLDRLHRPLAAKQPVELVLALVEVRHHRHAEGQAGFVHLGRARVGGVRRHADLHPVGDRASATYAAFSSNCCIASAGSLPKTSR